MHKYMKNFICKTYKKMPESLARKSLEIWKRKKYNVFELQGRKADDKIKYENFT